MAGKREFTRGVTPKGQVFWAHVYEPEEYEGKVTGFSVSMKFDQKETNALIAKIDNELEKAKSTMKLKPGQKWSSDPFLGYKEDKDGDIVFKFNTSESYKTKDGTVIKRTIPVFDAHGKPIKDMLSIGNGTIAKVAYTFIPYFMSKAINGVKLRLEAIQIIDLKEYGDKEAASFGFDKEDGFSAEEQHIQFYDSEKEDAEDDEDGDF